MNISTKNAVVVSAIGSIAIGAIILNALVVFVFLKFYRIWKINNVFIVSIAVCDLLKAFLGFSTDLSLLIDIKLVSRHSPVCLLSTYFTCSIAFTVIAHFTVISIVRWIAIFYPFLFRKWFKDTACHIFVAIVICYAYGFGWSALGFTPWSDFHVDIDGMRCSMDWKLRNDSSMSYILTVMVTCFVIPALIMLFVAVMVMRKVNSQKYKERKRKLSGIDKPPEMERERMFVRLIVCTAMAFYVAWTPYAICALLAVFRHPPPAVLVTASAVFAKLSALVNPICLCFIKSSFRKKLKSCFSGRESMSVERSPCAVSNILSPMHPLDEISVKDL